MREQTRDIRGRLEDLNETTEALYQARRRDHYRQHALADLDPLARPPGA